VKAFYVTVHTGEGKAYHTWRFYGEEDLRKNASPQMFRTFIEMKNAKETTRKVYKNWYDKQGRPTVKVTEETEESIRRIVGFYIYTIAER